MHNQYVLRYTIIPLLLLFMMYADFSRIDSNVEDTHMNVDAAHGEILKYFQSVTSNRWLMIKIFGVLILFFVIFVVFMT